MDLKTKYQVIFGKSISNLAGFEYLVTQLILDPGMADTRYRSYVLATVLRETAGQFKPVKEAYWLKESDREKYLSRYEFRKDLGNINKGDGIKYGGLGIIQITGRRNYEKFQKILDIPLLEKPELALDPLVSYKILSIGMLKGIFTGHKLSDHINDMKTDYFNARKIVNGLDHAQEIASNAILFEKLWKEV